MFVARLIEKMSARMTRELWVRLRWRVAVLSRVMPGWIIVLWIVGCRWVRAAMIAMIRWQRRIVVWIGRVLVIISYWQFWWWWWWWWSSYH